LKKVFCELAKSGQIDCFLKGGPRWLNKWKAKLKERFTEEECSAEAMAIILGGNVEGIYQVISKAQVRNPQQVMTIKKGTPLRVPTMTFSMASC